MEDNLSFDTTFLIDLQKERNRNGRAHRFLAAHGDAFFHWSSVAVGEFAEGFVTKNDPLLQRYLRFGTVLPVDLNTALIYAQVARYLLRTSGKLIGTNDVWIASTAIRYGLPLVTRNQDHFDRIPNLIVMVY